ncbi:MAG TPA: glycosyltransferase family 1 protein [Bryobacteraceae bacterium]|nr:glycosyltransferase family 1 protein [Bryobacteraceae bacterium]
MPLRIVLDVRRARDFGVGTYIRGLLSALAAIDSSSEYILITLPDDAGVASGLPPNFRTVSHPQSNSYYLNHLAFPLFLRRLSPSVVHLPMNLVPLLMTVPYVVTVHDMANLLFDRGSRFRKSARRFLLRRGLLRAKRILAVSEATRHDVRDTLGIPEDRIQLVHNAPNPDFFRPAQADRASILERYQINYPFLLYAGNIRPQKNIPRLVEAFAVARERLSRHPIYRDLHLIIIGDEISRYPSVRRAVIQTRVEKVVRFLGFVPFDALRIFFESAALFVFPSLYEGFGLPPLEAMATGTPVVASNVSSLPEVVGDAALLVNPEKVFEIAEAIMEGLLDDDLRAELIAKGKAQAARFSWDRTAREVLKVYREVGGG